MIVTPFWTRTLLSLLATCLAGCGPSPSPPDNPGPPAEGTRITGSESLAWQQEGDAPPEDLGYRFAVYVDSTLTELPQAACARASTPRLYNCSSPLPPLTPGRHVLEMVTWWVGSGRRSESSRAAPVVVILGTPVSAQASPVAPPLASESAPSSRAPGFQILASHLHELRQIAVLGDGRLMFLDAEGLRLLHPDGSLTTWLTPAEIGEPSAVILGFTHSADPRSVFVGYGSSTSADRTILSIARFREVGGRPGERAIVFRSGVDLPLSAIAVCRLRTDDEARLYFTVVARGEDDGIQPWVSLIGGVARINADGSTPRDNPAGTPIFARGGGRILDFDEEPVTKRLWSVQRAAGGGYVLAAVAESGEVSTESHRLTPGPSLGWSVPTLTIPDGEGATEILVSLGRELRAFQVEHDGLGQGRTIWQTPDTLEIIGVAANPHPGDIYVGLRERVMSGDRPGGVIGRLESRPESMAPSRSEATARRRQP